MIEWKNYHLATLNKIMDLGSYHRRLLKQWAKD